MTFDRPIGKDPTIVDGIGLYVEPGVNVEINLYINDDCLFIGKLENQGEDSIVYVKFKDKQNFSLNSPTTKIEIDVKGNADIMTNLSEMKVTSRLFVTEKPTGNYGTNEKYGIIPEKCFKILKSSNKSYIGHLLDLLSTFNKYFYYIAILFPFGFDLIQCRHIFLATDNTVTILRMLVMMLLIHLQI